MGTRVMPKQYVEVCGAPLVAHCLRVFARIKWIKSITLIVDDVEMAKHILRNEDLLKVQLVKGCNSRHKSIMEGLKAQSENCEVLIVHDGVRPFLEESVLEQITEKAYKFGACGIVRPLISTVVRPTHSDRLESCLTRADFRNSETPQAFAYQMIMNAYKRCSENELEHGTECLEIAMKHGGVIPFLVPISTDYMKVTLDEDLRTVKMILLKHFLKVFIYCHCHEYSLEVKNSICKGTECDKCLPFLSGISNANQKSHQDTPPLPFSKNKEYSDSNFPALTVNKLSLINHVKVCDSLNICDTTYSVLNHIYSDLKEIPVFTVLNSPIESYLPHEFPCLVCIHCLSSSSEIECIWPFQKVRDELVSYIDIFILDCNFILDDLFIRLRKAILEKFRDFRGTYVAVICENSPFNSNRRRSLQMLLRQILDDPFSKTLHCQILLY